MIPFLIMCLRFMSLSDLFLIMCLRFMSLSDLYNELSWFIIFLTLLQANYSSSLRRACFVIFIPKSLLFDNHEYKDGILLTIELFFAALLSINTFQVSSFKSLCTSINKFYTNQCTGKT